MPKFCQYCGAPLNEGARFCTNCGHPVAVKSQPSQQTQRPQQGNLYGQQPPQQSYTPRQPYGQPQGNPVNFQPSPQSYAPYQPPKKKWTPGKIILIVVLVLIAGAVFGIRHYEKIRKERIEQRLELSKSVINRPASQDDKSEKLGTTSEDIDEIIENEVKVEESEKSEESDEIMIGEIKVKDEDFFGVVVPIPDIGVVSKDVFQGDSTARSVYINNISYEQYVDYCKQLETLPGWKADSRWNVANLPEDYNERSARCIGEYQSMYVSLDYYDDKYAERSGGANFKLYVTSYE